jgi:hypothetical protein
VKLGLALIFIAVGIAAPLASGSHQLGAVSARSSTTLELSRWLERSSARALE